MAPVRARSEGLDWSAWRSVVFVSGCAIVFAAGGPPLASIAERHLANAPCPAHRDDDGGALATRAQSTCAPRLRSRRVHRAEKMRSFLPVQSSARTPSRRVHPCDRRLCRLHVSPPPHTDLRPVGTEPGRSRRRAPRVRELRSAGSPCWAPDASTRRLSEADRRCRARRPHRPSRCRLGGQRRTPPCLPPPAPTPPGEALTRFYTHCAELVRSDLKESPSATDREASDAIADLAERHGGRAHGRSPGASSLE
jgi:hypothetical protein